MQPAVQRTAVLVPARQACCPSQPTAMPTFRALGIPLKPCLLSCVVSSGCPGRARAEHPNRIRKARILRRRRTHQGIRNWTRSASPWDCSAAWTRRWQTPSVDWQLACGHFHLLVRQPRCLARLVPCRCLRLAAEQQLSWYQRRGGPTRASRTRGAPRCRFEVPWC